MKTRVAVVYGGRSGEHEISLLSAESVIAAMNPDRYQITRFLIDKEGHWSPRAIMPEPGAEPDIDVVFPVLHGTFGEDGTMQGLFELADLPYVGANVLASAVSMDKDVMKRVCRDQGLPVIDWMVLDRDGHCDTAEEVAKKLSFPIFVKPANLGSSVGISKAHNPAELCAALKKAAEFDRKIVVERGIEGREFECAVLGNEHPAASVPCEILPSREFYDYEDKYELNLARTELPPNLAPAEDSRNASSGGRVFQGSRLRRYGPSRFPPRRSDGQTLHQRDQYDSGLHCDQHVPEDVGIHRNSPTAQLIDRLIELAMERHEQKKATRFTR